MVVHLYYLCFLFPPWSTRGRPYHCLHSFLFIPLGSTRSQCSVPVVGQWFGRAPLLFAGVAVGWLLMRACLTACLPHVTFLIAPQSLNSPLCHSRLPFNRFIYRVLAHVFSKGWLGPFWLKASPLALIFSRPPSLGSPCGPPQGWPFRGCRWWGRACLSTAFPPLIRGGAWVAVRSPGLRAPPTGVLP